MIVQSLPDAWEDMWFLNARRVDEDGLDERTVGVFATQYEAKEWGDKTLSPSGWEWYTWRLRKPTVQ